ncbi:MAG TPA: hypothetical protein VF765_27390 [Polyangiaceae bacterium]
MTIHINPNPMRFTFNSNELLPESEESGAEPGTEAGTEPMPTYLTPDALLTYCESRLQGLDSQIQQGIQTQNDANDDQKDLTPVQAALSKYADGCHDPSSVKELLAAVQQAISSIESRDPGSPALSGLKQMLSSIQTGQTTPSPFTEDMIQRAKGMGITIDMPDVLSADQIKGLSTTLGQITSSESSSAELNMINLQSLMSQRQTAVELTTNMMQTLNDTLSKVVSNVGR